MGIRLVASDLDGTLFTDEKTISDETRRTLEEIAEKENFVYSMYRKGICFHSGAGADAAWRSVYDRIKWRRCLPGRGWRRMYGSTLSVDTVDRILSLPISRGDDIRSADSGTVLYRAALH